MTSIIIENGIERQATQEEIEYINSTRLSLEQEQESVKTIFVRKERDTKLAECDWVITRAVEKNAEDGLGVQVPQVWLDYRQALRDIPQQDGFPLNVIWPEEP